MERKDDVERVVVWLDETLAEALDAFVIRCGYESRSDAVRDLIRARVYSTDGSARGRARTRSTQERRDPEREFADRARAKATPRRQ